MSSNETLVSAPHRRLWADLRAALRGDAEQDYTTGSLRRAIFLLAIPMALEMVMQSVFEVLDIFFVSKLGPDAVAGVGLSASLLIIVYALAMGLSMAVTATVARRVGEKDPTAAAHAAAQGILLGLLVALPMVVIGVAFAPQLLRLMGAEPAAVAAGTGYCRVLFGGSGTMLLMFLINAIFRGAGDATLAMRALWLANIINCVLDPLLIFGIGPFPELGVAGAAWTDVIGRGVGVGYQCYMLFRGRSRIRLHRASFRIDPPVMGSLTKIAIPGVIQHLLDMGSWVVLIGLVARFGSDVVAGYTIAVRLFVFTLLPSWGMGNAAATLVGQNLGAEKPERAEHAVWVTAWCNLVLLSVFGLALYALAEPLIRLFTAADAVVPYGVMCLQLVSLCYPAIAFGMVTFQAFNGAGDTRTPTIISIFCYWAFRLPVAWLLAYPLGLGADGPFWAVSAAEVLYGIAGVWAFRKGWWKLKMV
jgi:putative MATE family efflux protein